MEKDIVEGKLGEVASYDVEFKGGKFRAEMKAGAHGITAGALIEVEAEVVVKKLIAKAKEAIKGPYDDAVLGLVENMLISALKA